MRWQGRRQSTNVRDIRGQRGGGGFGGGFPGGMNFPGGGGLRIPTGGPRTAGGGGLGCGTLIVIGVVLWLLGINPLTILSGGQMVPDMSTKQMPRIDRQAPQGGTRSNDEKSQFVSTILGSTEEVWSGIFESYGRDYPAPELVLFSGGVQSACGMASAASGPFYCPGDKRVYIDLSFYDQLEREFGAGGDFAQAYVLAHEVGHHVQNIIGVLPEFNRMRQSMGKLEVNQMSVQVELQADCFAGVWGHYVAKEGWLERGDLEEAINAAEQIGDDTIQRRTQGYVVPDAFNHGTSQQRKEWFSRGFEQGRLEACDTFNGR
jgi:predicted metalloprotease